MRRFALPFAVSLIAHGLLVALLWRYSRQHGVGSGAASGAFDGPALRLSIASIEPPRRLEPPTHETEWNVDLEPARLVTAHSASGESTPPIVPASLLRSGNPPSSTSNGTGTPGPIPASTRGSAALATSKQIQKVVYLLDRSSSMGPRGVLYRAIDELRLALSALPSHVQFQVFVYHRHPIPLVPAPLGLALATPEHVALARGALDDLSPSGATDHVSALRRALALRPEWLFLLTDNDDLSDRDVLAIRQANRGGTILHVVEFSGDPSPTLGPLSRWAVATGGSHRRVRP